MNRIERAFASGKAFIPFVTAGDPSLDTTLQLVVGMARAGADLIEIGIPFSDPVAEGEVIQHADERALSSGTTTDKIFEMVRGVRASTDVALAFMTYINPVFVYGPERFLAACEDCGVDALIVPDLPFEEKGELLPFCEKHGVTLISLIAPTSSERIEMIADAAQGFVYCVSSMGVTGVREKITTDLSSMIALVKKRRDIPCAVGFGISTPEQAQRIARIADGVIVGSAVVRLVEKHGVQSVAPVCDYVHKMKRAVCAGAE